MQACLQNADGMISEILRLNTRGAYGHVMENDLNLSIFNVRSEHWKNASCSFQSLLTKYFRMVAVTSLSIKKRMSLGRKTKRPIDTAHPHGEHMKPREAHGFNVRAG